MRERLWRAIGNTITKFRPNECLQADPAHVRPACQLRPLSDVTVPPLVPPGAQAVFLHRR